MFATIRRYEATDKSRTSELVKKADEVLVPKLRELPGFGGYSLIDTGDGVLSSIGFYETSEQCDEASRVAATWVSDEKFEGVLPNPPKITNGEVVLHKTSELVQA
jgi:hypothetical protein